MLPDWKTNTVFLPVQLPVRHPAVSSCLVRVLKLRGVWSGWVEGTRDIWLRDFLPVQVSPTGFVQFRYDPPYLKRQPWLKTGAAVGRSVVSFGQCNVSEIKLDGGNVIATEKTVILTERVFDDNPGWGRKQLQGELSRLLQVERCLFVPPEPGDLFGHSDGMLRFINDDALLVNDYTGQLANFGRHLRTLLRRAGLEVALLPYFTEETGRARVPSAVGCYQNFLRVGQVVFAPVYNVAADDLALRVMHQVMPGVEVIPVFCTPLAKEGGVLHCVSWSISMPSARALWPGRICREGR